MLSTNPTSLRLSIATLTLGMIATFGIPAWGQEAPAIHVGNTRITGLPDDWSHHHQVFSNPGTEENAIRKGTHDRWQAVVNDPRYVIHELKRNLPVEGPAADDVKMRYREAAEDAEIWNKFHRDPRERRHHKDGAPNPSNPALARDWSMSLGSGGHLGAGQYPAKYNFSITTANCNDYVVFPTGLAGGATQAAIVAYNQLYDTTCGTTATRPNVAWAYNTPTGGVGAGGTASLSPVVSYTGNQVAYIQQVAGAAATLVLLKPSPITGANAASPTAISFSPPASYRACTAPCYTTITLNGSPTDTNSAPFYRYDNDVMYVGDNAGKLHQFTGVFNGTPAEVTVSWPISVSANVLTSPVYDSGASGNIFVADSGGFLYSYKASTAAPQMTSSKLTFATGSVGIVDGPLVDSTTEKVYVFVGDDANTSGSLACTNATGCSGVFQFAAGLATGVGSLACVATSTTAWSGSNCGEESVFGIGTIATPTAYDGAFDQIYQAGTGATGNLWACIPHVASEPRLSFVPMQSGNGIAPTGSVLSIATTAITTLTSAQATCSPVTEVYGSGGTTNDYIFLSVSGSSSLSGVAGCAAGNSCLYNFLVGNGVTESTPTNATAGIIEAGGTSGIVIDNTNSTVGESQIYFTTLANQVCVGNGTTGNATGGCAVQVSQSGLN